MNIKKIFLILIIILCLSGCVRLDVLNYDEIINNFSLKPKNANVHKKGYKFYIPKGLQLEDSGTNYAIISSKNVNYYLYIDLISYNQSKEINYEINSKAEYSKTFNKQDKLGYLEIVLWENEQYLIEIMYNYAKIEVMVDKSLINEALVNSINILNSIKYNNLIIEDLLNDDNLDYTEEIFDLFEHSNDNSNVLDYEEVDETLEEEEKVIDTDYIN